MFLRQHREKRLACSHKERDIRDAPRHQVDRSREYGLLDSDDVDQHQLGLADQTYPRVRLTHNSKAGDLFDDNTRSADVPAIEADPVSRRTQWSPRLTASTISVTGWSA